MTSIFKEVYRLEEMHASNYNGRQEVVSAGTMCRPHAEGVPRK